MEGRREKGRKKSKANVCWVCLSKARPTIVCSCTQPQYLSTAPSSLAVSARKDPTVPSSSRSCLCRDTTLFPVSLSRSRKEVNVVSSSRSCLCREITLFPVSLSRSRKEANKVSTSTTCLFRAVTLILPSSSSRRIRAKLVCSSPCKERWSTHHQSVH